MLTAAIYTTHTHPVESGFYQNLENSKIDRTINQIKAVWKIMYVSLSRNIDLDGERCQRGSFFTTRAEEVNDVEASLIEFGKVRL